MASFKAGRRLRHQGDERLLPQGRARITRPSSRPSRSSMRPAALPRDPPHPGRPDSADRGYEHLPTDLDIGIGEANRKRWLRDGKCSFLPIEREWMERLKRLRVDRHLPAPPTPPSASASPGSTTAPGALTRTGPAHRPHHGLRRPQGQSDRDRHRLRAARHRETSDHAPSDLAWSPIWA